MRVTGGTRGPSMGGPLARRKARFYRYPGVLSQTGTTWRSRDEQGIAEASVFVLFGFVILVWHFVCLCEFLY